MAQQTINVGAAPNDGTGTPLRTAFQYTNSNFSELYTAVGPSGNNITVPGTATITGDLTVDTSTLKVDSANNRVGIGTATPGAGYSLDILGAAVGGIRVSSNNYPNLVIDSANSNGALIYIQEGGTTQARIGHLTAVTGLEFSGNNGTAATNVHYAIDSTGISTWSNVGGVAGTAMTLNSTGLGVGNSSPAAALDLTNTGVTASREIRIENSAVRTFLGVEGSSGRFVGSATNNAYFGCSGAFGLEFATNNNVRMVVDSSGNVGIGVTPSGKLEVQESGTGGGIGGIIASTASSGGNAGYVFRTGGTNRWSLSITGSAGAESIRFYDINNSATRMTLDASGNLLVGTTTSTVNNNGYRVVNDGNTNSARLELGSVSSTNSNIGLSMYSTGAAAYRFYVGWGGTVFATNTTISGISDARLKENVQDIDVGLGAILALKPRKFDWKAGKGKDIKGDRGFIAQEFEQVFPNLIDEWKDPAPEGEAPYKSVRQDLIPVLVKAIQELAAEVNALKNA